MRTGKNALVFVRHGEPLFPEKGEKYFLGRTDWPLSERGKSQADSLRVLFDKMEWDACFTSPLVRAKQTAEIACADLPIAPVGKAELAELNLGEWDGRTRKELEKKFPRLFRERESDFFGFRFPGGDSFAYLAQRAVPFLVSILKEKGRRLVFSHIGVYRVLLHDVFGLCFPDVFT
ncbi:MAG: histidine phosphatase family protein, partial [Synergistota bacterium]|nr:histidine phosphatase family protein [Synergistota bacterium]